MPRNKAQRHYKATAMPLSAKRIREIIDAAPVVVIPNPLPLYTVVRNGEFKCRLNAENQCGPAGTSQFDYRATIEGHVLDGDDRTRGIDNFLIEHYGMADRVSAVFGFGKWQASCEAFAGSIVKMIHEMMGGRATRIHVSIKPGGLAEIQLEWRQGQSLPTLLAVRL